MGALGGPAGPHLLPLVVGLSHLDVPHQAAPRAGVQDVDNSGHEVVDVNRLGVIRGAQLWEKQGMSKPPNHQPLSSLLIISLSAESGSEATLLPQ